MERSTLAEAAAGLWGRPATCFKCFQRRAATIRQRKPGELLRAKTQMCGDSSFAWNPCDSPTLINAAPQHAEGANQRV